MYPIQEVLSAIGRGYSTSSEIAPIIGIKRNIISAHLTSLFQLDLIRRTGVRRQEKGSGPSEQVYGIK